MIWRFLLLFVLIAFSTIKAQSKIDKAIENLETNYSQEKIYLLLNKDTYLNGETIFFKSFVFDGYQLSNISNTLFVELYDHDKKLLDKKTILLKNGESEGSFKLDENLQENVYFIRSYTPWMANFPEKFQNLQLILIYNPQSEKKLAVSTGTDWTAKIFAESGNFIADTSTKFAVRLFHKESPVYRWNGYIIDKQIPTEKITTFQNFDENISTFTITPERNKEYQAVIEDLQGNKKTVDLPAIAENGVSLQVNSDKNGIKYRIKENNLPENLKNYRIIGTINNRLAYSATITKPLKEFSYTIPSTINDGQNGILLLSVFDEKENLVAERLCFIKAEDLQIEKPDLSGVHLNPSPRSKNEFEIKKLKDFDHYSVLVQSSEIKETPDINDQNNLLSTLWLTGDFFSKIENPAQYFSNKRNPDALDALLITEKWTRFEWTKLFAELKPTIKYKTQKFLSWKGKLALNSRAFPNTSLNLVLQNTNLESSLFNAVTDDKGYFILDNIIYDKPFNIRYFLNENTKNKVPVPDNLTLTFESLVDFVPYKSLLPQTKFHLIPRTDNELPPEIKRALINKNNRITLKNKETGIEEIVIKRKKMDQKKKLNNELSTGLFTTMNAVVFDFVNENQNARSGNVLQWLQGRVGGLSFRTDVDGTFTPFIRGSVAEVYLNEIHVDAGDVSTIAISDIAMVKILRNKMLGNAIAIYLRKGNMGTANEDLDRKKNTVILNGYDEADSFDEISFKKDSYNEILDDTRQTLYWNPSVSHDSDLPLRIEFFNNDFANKFKVTIISFSADGAPLLYDVVLE